ncbi:hypothetical protein EDB86DRAFT_2933105 [Lactarius hatsudake]|nr:hypothetical protein EDB86DRAFT_2987815 [Lactarius hatsudake]KAH8981470.1 hypothetical protein EDB86DRAFT_2975478 [Lactarius hatsudake]KAH8992133.1 hypothetical protein EDB86DRAFT_2933105 [Lactarius hatsudake]
MGFRFPETLCLAARVAWILALPVVNFLSEILQADMRFRLLPETFYPSSTSCRRSFRWTCASASSPRHSTLHHRSILSAHVVSPVNLQSIGIKCVFVGSWYHLTTSSIAPTRRIQERSFRWTCASASASSFFLWIHLPLPLYLAVNIIDGFLSAQVMSLVKLQLVGIRCVVFGPWCHLQSISSIVPTHFVQGRSFRRACASASSGTPTLL